MDEFWNQEKDWNKKKLFNSEEMEKIRKMIDEVNCQFKKDLANPLSKLLLEKWLKERTN